MPIQRASLQTFLSTAKEHLKAAIKDVTPVTFIIGNESADLDSICSAVLFAYVRTYWRLPQAARFPKLYVPLSNIPRKDISLRPELVPVFKHGHLKPSHLITLSDLPGLSEHDVSSQLSPEKTNWILVDHNRLQGMLGEIYGSRVIGCIDHHEDEPFVPKSCGDEPRIIRKSGSCASLVTEQCREAWDALSKSNDQENTKQWDKEIAMLALAPILIDTTDLTASSRTEAVDLEAVNYLEEKIGRQGFDRGTFFKELTEAKEDVGGLTIDEILRKDYKSWLEGNLSLGICAAVRPLKQLMEKAGSPEAFLDALQSFAEERKLSVCSVMTTATIDGDFQRELLVWGTGKSGVDVLERFEGDTIEKLELQPWHNGALDLDGENEKRRGWQQMNFAASRKHVAPLLRDAVKASMNSII